MCAAVVSEALYHEVLPSAQPRTALTVWASGVRKHSHGPVPLACTNMEYSNKSSTEQDMDGSCYPPPLVVNCDGPDAAAETGAFHLCAVHVVFLYTYVFY